MRRVRIIETGEEFRSLTECARYIDGRVESIHKCLVGRLRQHCGFTFEYVDKSVPYLKLGEAIKNSLRDKTLFDEKKFVMEMERKNDK